MVAYVAEGGEFERDTDYITTRITADGRDGYPVEPGRYRLMLGVNDENSHKPGTLEMSLTVPAS